MPNLEVMGEARRRLQCKPGRRGISQKRKHYFLTEGISIAKGGRARPATYKNIYQYFRMLPDIEEDCIARRLSGKGRNGRAFLFSHVMNVTEGEKQDRHLITGLHTVADVSCSECKEILGWKYERAYEETQKYKEGKYILEKSKIMKENW